MSCVVPLAAFCVLLGAWYMMFRALRGANQTNRALCRELVDLRVALARERWTSVAARQPSGPLS